MQYGVWDSPVIGEPYKVTGELVLTEFKVIIRLLRPFRIAISISIIQILYRKSVSWFRGQVPLNPVGSHDRIDSIAASIPRVYLPVLPFSWLITSVVQSLYFHLLHLFSLTYILSLYPHFTMWGADMTAENFFKLHLHIFGF